MNLKKKGTNAERDIIHQLWSLNWAACRVAGSGSSKYPSPDIFAGRNGRIITIEAKCTKFSNQYFTKEEISQLREFSTIIGAEPFVAIKFGPSNWCILRLEDLDEKEGSFAINHEKAKLRGLLIEEAFG